MFAVFSCLFRVEWLVVDESDKLFEDGKTGFREQLAQVFLACSSSKVRRAFFSATCTTDVEQWCRLNLDNLVSVNIGHRLLSKHTSSHFRGFTQSLSCIRKMNLSSSQKHGS